MKLVVVGTDTGIGKTVFSAALALGLGASYWKPVQAGLEGETDTQFALRMGVIVLPEAYRLTSPMSAHLAADRDGLFIDADRLAVPAVDPLVIETAGGLLSPLTFDRSFADVLDRWRLPVVLCASTRLGTINHSLLTLEALRKRGIEPLGVAFVGDAQPESEDSVARIGKTKRLGRLPWLAELTGPNLERAFAANFALGDFQP